MKPELLFLAHRIPYPPDRGDKKPLREVFDAGLSGAVSEFSAFLG